MKEDFDLFGNNSSESDWENDDVLNAPTLPMPDHIILPTFG
jgi:hypothetical protein